MAKKQAAAVANMFDSAPVVKVKTPVSKDTAAREVEIGASLDYLAAINALTTSLNTVKVVYETEIKSMILENFVDFSMEQGKRAANFTGKGMVSEANCQLKKRASTSVLTAEELDLLKANGISFDVATVHEEIPEHYFFNQEVLSDPSITAKISAKLAEIPELEGKQVIIKQAGREKVTKNIVSENSFDEISKIQDRDLVKQLLSTVSSLALKDKLNTQDMDAILDLVRKSGIKI